MNSDRSMSSPSPTPMQSTMRGQHVWQPDASAKKCTICDSAFNLIRRRHHCRRCGSVICNDCSMHRLRIPVTRIAINSKPHSHPERPSTANSTVSSDGDDMDVVRVCDTCYSKHQQLKSKRKARAASIESNNTTLTHMSRQSSRQSSRHSSPSSSIHITNEHNQPITHQLLRRPSSSNQLTSTVINNQLHAQSRSPHAPAQASVLPSIPSLPRTPRQIDQTINPSKNQEQRTRSQSSSDTITTTISPSSAIKRSMSSASQVLVDLDDRHSVDASTIVRSQSGSPSSTRQLEIVTTTNPVTSSQTAAVSRRSPKLRSSNNLSLIQSNNISSSSAISNDAVSPDFMSPKSVHHRSEFVAPAWCDNVLVATGISLPLSNQTAINQSVNQSLQTEAFMDSLDFLSWIHPILKLFRSFAAAFADRPVACMIVVPLILIILHRLRPFYQTILVIVQLFTLHNAIWRLLSTNENVENRTIKQTVTAIVHTFLHDTTTPFISSQSDKKKLITTSNNRATDLAWLCFGLFACYLSYFVHWPVFWSACLVKDFARVVVKKHKTN